MKHVAAGLCVCAALLLVTGCKREQRQLRAEPAERATFAAAPESPIVPGGKVPVKVEVRNPYEGDAYAIAEGEKLFSSYNCGTCHAAHGGGGMGPPLTSKNLTYGSEPENIFDTIQKGRPKGMPAWGGRLPEYQIWQLVAYVRSLSGQEPMSATPGRSDDIEYKTKAQLK
ncbi:MAG TPA: c-type cytochrome [Bryobacteraceae bacterium]|nr:c-type cytochrome [Bryobacteraceae bacterium]